MYFILKREIVSILATQIKDLNTSFQVMHKHFVAVWKTLKILTNSNQILIQRKLHAPAHYEHVINLFGVPDKANTETFEHDHQYFTTSIFRHISHRHDSMNLEMTSGLILKLYNHNIQQRHEIIKEGLQYFINKGQPTFPDEIQFTVIKGIQHYNLVVPINISENINLHSKYNNKDIFKYKSLTLTNFTSLLKINFVE